MNLKPIVQPLVTWYHQNKRSLPWRDFPTPYRVWVSEIMLQQTRVDPAIPYFERFIATLPDIAALATAKEETVLKLWEGLGYYSRVRNLQRAAQIVLRDYNGVLPQDPALLVKLPGIGEYTAGAIASIAYQVPAPAVDGNVLRVISRITASKDDIALPQTKRTIQNALTAVLPQDRPGDFNQALMDLGATVCIPNGEPHCTQCPLLSLCKAHQKNLISQIPQKTKKQSPLSEEKTVFLITHNGKIALTKRPKSGLLAGLWEFPNVAEKCTQKRAKEVLLSFGITAAQMHALVPKKHVFTHKIWALSGFAVTALAKDTAFVWATAQELQETYSLPTAFRVYLKDALELLQKET